MEGGNLEIGYALVESLWGYRFASEIVATLLQHARKHHPNKEIIGIVNIENRASASVLLKKGFKLKTSRLLDNNEVDYYHFSK